MLAARQIYQGNAGIDAQIIWRTVGVVIGYMALGYGSQARVFWDSGIGGDWD